MKLCGDIEKDLPRKNTEQHREKKIILLTIPFNSVALRQNLTKKNNGQTTNIHHILKTSLVRLSFENPCQSVIIRGKTKL